MNWLWSGFELVEFSFSGCFSELAVRIVILFNLSVFLTLNGQFLSHL